MNGDFVRRRHGREAGASDGRVGADRRTVRPRNRQLARHAVHCLHDVRLRKSRFQVATSIGHVPRSPFLIRDAKHYSLVREAVYTVTLIRGYGSSRVGNAVVFVDSGCIQSRSFSSLG